MISFFSAREIQLLQEFGCVILNGCDTYVRLVYKHSQGPTVAPSKFRMLLERALQLFPANRLLLSLFIHWEARTRIENRLRRFFDDTMQK